MRASNSSISSSVDWTRREGRVRLSRPLLRMISDTTANNTNTMCAPASNSSPETRSPARPEKAELGLVGLC